MYFISFKAIRCAVVGVMLICGPVLHPAWAADREAEPPGRFSPLGLYQRFVSGADGQRCPMYPSCSHYAREAFNRNGFWMGWILSCDRLLRCGRDEIRLTERRHGGAYDPLEANTFWWDKKLK